MIIHRFETIDSTNGFLKNRPGGDEVEVCLAEQQTQGRGRFDRKWYSPPGLNIYLSCRYRFHQSMKHLAGLSLVVGLAVVNSLNELGVTQHLALKWPNDIVWDRKKLGGCLIEMLRESEAVSDAIIGIGLNVNMCDADETHIPQAWTSLQKIVGHPMDREMLSKRLIDNLVFYVKQFEINGLAQFSEEWQRYDVLIHHDVSVIQNNQRLEGKVKGIDRQGNLLLRSSDGMLHTISAGEASLEK